MITPHASRLTPHASRLTPHASRLTPHASRLTPHASRLLNKYQFRLAYLFPVFLFAVTFHCNFLIAQTNYLITASDLTDAQLSDNQLFRKQKFQNSTYVETFQLVELGNPLELQENGILELQLPGSSTTYNFRAKQVNSSDNGDYSWIGELISPVPCNEDTVENDCIFGILTILKRGARRFGEIWIDTTYYQIKDVGEGLNALIKLDVDAIPDKGCGAPIDTTIINETEERGDSVCPVRLLVLYTHVAKSTHPDILDIIDLAVANMNSALRRSAISEDQLDIILAGTDSLTVSEFNESQDIDYDRFSLPANNAINDKRDEFNADIVVILTDAVYSEANGAVTAFGDNMNDADSAFAIVEAASANAPFYSFTHEIGHLFGARHEGKNICPGDGDNSGLAYAHGWIIKKGGFLFFKEKKWKTVMGVCSGINVIPRILNFSNPYVLYKLKQTGKAGTNYNARVLSDAACRVGRYVLSDEPGVHIIGPTRLCPEEERQVIGNVSGVPGPYEYRWQTSEDGVNFSNPWITSSNSFWIIAPATIGEVIFVRLTAGNVNGAMMTVTKAIEADTAGLLCEHPRPVSLTGLTSTPQNIRVFPNPAAGELNVELTGFGNSTLYISLMDVLGRVIYRQSAQTAGSEKYMLNLDVHDLPNGIYWLRTQNAFFNETVRLILSR